MSYSIKLLCSDICCLVNEKTFIVHISSQKFLENTIDNKKTKL